MAIERTLILKTKDTLGNAYEKKFSNANPSATDEQIDTFARGLAGLSQNSYDDTICQDSKSINQALKEAEENG